MGRWTSPDWSDKPQPVPYADFSKPQTLDLYSYGRNNPLSNTDLDGHCTSRGNQQGFWWCLTHYSDQDKLSDAKGYFSNNRISMDGKRVDPSKMTDSQLLQVWQAFNDRWKAIAATGVNPGVVMAGAAAILTHHRDRGRSMDVCASNWTANEERQPGRDKHNSCHPRPVLSLLDLAQPMHPVKTKITPASMAEAMTS